MGLRGSLGVKFPFANGVGVLQMSFKKSSGQASVGFVFQTNPAGPALAKPPSRQSIPRSATHAAPG